jgi:hypothetical protein
MQGLRLVNIGATMNDRMFDETNPQQRLIVTTMGLIVQELAVG